MVPRGHEDCVIPWFKKKITYVNLKPCPIYYTSKHQYTEG